MSATPFLDMMPSSRSSADGAEGLAGGEDPLPDGLAQFDRYLDRLSLDTGVLVVFDRRPEAPPWKERGGFEQATTPSGREVTVLRV
ncbi:hypothetical protein ACIBO5_17245 [Nonomuraea angiospora]|uniref:hypothetical protein n=1 Tax=Nonomuraea angiospora TaxID=46172 RepID=UPI00378F00F7